MNAAETITRKLHLYFPKCECEKPIVYHLVKDFGLIVNIFRAKVTPEEEGWLVLDVTGTEEAIEKGMAYVRSFNVTITDVSTALIWKEDRCTHCGNCIPHCPTGALHIPDRSTMRVAFDQARCIECLSCVENCPYGACEAPF